MISGRGSGSGKYSYQETHDIGHSVMVSHMPEDSFSVRIVFKHKGEVEIPILRLGENQAVLLWSSLRRMAKDLKWDDRLMEEKLSDIDKDSK